MEGQGDVTRHDCANVSPGWLYGKQDKGRSDRADGSGTFSPDSVRREIDRRQRLPFSEYSETYVAPVSGWNE